MSDLILINVNIANIYNIINKKIIGIIALNKDYFIYYTDDKELNDYLHIIYYKQINGSVHKIDNINIVTDKVNVINKSFLYGLSDILPFPYYVKIIIYKQINNVNDVYRIFNELKLREA